MCLPLCNGHEGVRGFRCGRHLSIHLIPSCGFNVTASQPTEFGLRLRIPAWAVEPSVSVNGKLTGRDLSSGQFTELRRVWKSGDQVELSLPMSYRLKAVDAQHPDIVALKYGPLVLFPISSSVPEVTRQELLGARRAEGRSWQI